MASDADHLTQTLQIALCHLFFNITGIILYYPIPFMRWPIPAAKILGATVARYR
jgi:sodium-dependent phosphate cotransporter